MGDQREDQTDPKKTHKETALKNYRPIMCPSMMRKILTAQIRLVIFNSSISRVFLPNAQKGCCMRTRGTEELLYIHKNTLNQSKRDGKISLWPGLTTLTLTIWSPQSSNCIKYLMLYSL